MLSTPLLARGDDPFESTDVTITVSEERLRHILFELECGEGVGADELLAELIRLGPGTVGPLFDALSPSAVLESGSVTAGEAPEARGSSTALGLEERRRGQLELALRAIPAAVLQERRSAGEAWDDPDAARVALAVLERTGGARELSLCLDLAHPGAEDARPERALARAFEGALTGLLTRDAAAYTVLDRGFFEIDPALQPAVVRALGAVGTRDALEVLARILGGDAALDLTVLTQVNRVTISLGQPYDWSFLLRVRSYLSSRDPALRRESALAVGRMEDVEAFLEVLELLRDEDPGVRQNAYWALCAISGRKLPQVFERWHRWYAGELDWWNHEAPEQLAAIGRGTEAQRVHALAGLSSHRLFRHELARELLWFLDRGEPEVLQLVCSTLAGLRSSVPVPALVELLQHEDAGVRRQAWRALRAITGRDLPESFQAWAPLTPH